MSDYYDIDKPYKIADWNRLVKAVNEILEDPPEDSECEPVDPLEEVSDPHRWSVKDIKAMQDALIETCPSLEFTEDLIKWTLSIIDDIEEGMDKAWCECLGKKIEIDYVIDPQAVEGESQDPDTEQLCDGYVATMDGPFHSDQSSRDPCEQNMVHSSRTVSFTYSSPCFLVNYDNNFDIKEEAYDLFEPALDKTEEYIDKWNEIIPYSQKIHKEQLQVDSYAAQVDSAIDAYEACLINSEDPSECDFLKPPICIAGTKATEHQEVVTENVTSFQANFEDIETLKTEADDLALEQFTLLSEMPLDYDIEGNEDWCTRAGIILEDKLNGGTDWCKFIEPDNLDPEYEVDFADIDDGTPGAPGHVIPKITLAHHFYYPAPAYSSRVAGEHVFELNMFLSPGGHIFLEDTYSTSTDAITWYAYRIREVEHVCAGFSPKIEWTTETQSTHTHGCAAQDDFCLEYSMLGPTKLKGDLIKTTIEEDFTEDQEEYFILYSGWYKEHPQYDNRHQAYC